MSKSNGKGGGKTRRKAAQPWRTYRNKQRQRARHAKRYPNDTSLDRAIRWTKPPEAKKK